MEEFILRPSTVQSWQYCPGRPGQALIQGYNHYPNEALLFGTVTHARIEHALLGEQVPSYDELLAEAWLKDLPDSIPVKERIPIEEVTTKGQRHDLLVESELAFDTWAREVLPRLPSEGWVIEETVRKQIGKVVNLNGDLVDVILRGTPDLFIRSTNQVLDWKTAGKGWDGKKWKSQLQRILYPMMLAEEPMPIALMVYWVYDRKAQWWKPHECPRPTKAELMAAQSIALTCAQGLITNTFGYTPVGSTWAKDTDRGWHCSPKYCDAWEVCTGKHLVADGKAELPAPTLRERWSA